MIRVNILYPNTPGCRFDYDYYINSHIPMTARLLAPALRGITIERGLAGTVPDEPPAFVVCCHLEFDSIAAFMTAFTPVASELQGDIPNYTDVSALIQFSEIWTVR